MKKFVFTDMDEKGVLVTAEDKHKAISAFVESGEAENMSDFYYGLEDGQISIIEIIRELNET